MICFKIPPQEPYLSEPEGERETKEAGFCDSVWRVEPTILQETEANLVATVYNAGKVCCTWGDVKFGYWGYKIQTLHIGIIQVLITLFLGHYSNFHCSCASQCSERSLGTRLV